MTMVQWDASLRVRCLFILHIEDVLIWQRCVGGLIRVDHRVSMVLSLEQPTPCWI